MLFLYRPHCHSGPYCHSREGWNPKDYPHITEESLRFSHMDPSCANLAFCEMPLG